MVASVNSGNLEDPKHPRLSRFVDSAWTRLFGQFAIPLVLAILGGVWAWGNGKIDTLNDLAKSMPSLSASMSEIGKKLDQQIRSQQIAVEHIKNTEKDITDLKVELKVDEKAIGDTNTDAAATRTRIDDLKDDIKKLESIAQQNLSISQSHSDDIHATRNAVAPKNDR